MVEGLWCCWWSKSGCEWSLWKCGFTVKKVFASYDGFRLMLLVMKYGAIWFEGEIWMLIGVRGWCFDVGNGERTEARWLHVNGEYRL